MYSLYRAWLMHQDAFNSTIGSTPPDVLLQVGPAGTQFTAHRAILIAHSGYFKSVLAQQTSPILVSNIGVSEFTSLLTFMYTGFLDLNLENIYNILLATHLLHMPNALEICRNFLIQNNHLLQHPESRRLIDTPIYSDTPPVVLQQSSSAGTIIKPIPSRKFLPNTFRFEPILPTQSSIQLNENTSFHKIDSINKKPLTNDKKPIENDDEEDTQHTNSTTSSEKIIEIVKLTTSPKPSTSFRRTPSPKHSDISDNEHSISLSPNISETKLSSTDEDAIIQYTTKKVNKKFKKTNLTTSSSEDSKVIIDIACCDGPVRFHRVLNNSYGLSNINDNSQIKNYIVGKSKTDIMNKIMTANINMKKLNEENSPNEQQNDAELIYTCVYCNHTFKSQYCYQKHARRHINPITLNSTCKILLSGDNSTSEQQRSPSDSGGGDGVVVLAPGHTGNATTTSTSNKREVKLLDMNVQYYPCKTCGSKFPSYYFVHKHRKMYHADEMIGEKESENSNEKQTTVPLSKENDG